MNFSLKDKTVVITGSSIKRIQSEGALPVQVMLPSGWIVAALALAQLQFVEQREDRDLRVQHRHAGTHQALARHVDLLLRVEQVEVGPEAGDEGLAHRVDGGRRGAHHLLLHGDLLARLGRHDEARALGQRAADLTRNARERELLLARAHQPLPEGGPR